MLQSSALKDNPLLDDSDVALRSKMGLLLTEPHMMAARPGRIHRRWGVPARLAWICERPSHAGSVAFIRASQAPGSLILPDPLKSDVQI